MIIRTIATCIIVIFGILLIFCLCSTPDVPKYAGNGQGMVRNASHPSTGLSQGHLNQETSAPFDPSNHQKPRFKRKFRDLPEMNFPPGFYFVAMPIMHVLLMYFIGIIINDFSREDQESVEKLFGTFN